MSTHNFPPLPSSSGGNHLTALELGVAVAVYQGVDFLAGLAVGAVPIVIACVAGQVVDGIDGADGVALHGLHGGVDGGHTGYIAAVVVDGLQRLLGGETGGHGGHQHQHVFAPNHIDVIVPENDLGVGVVLRLQNIDGVVGVDGAETTLGQLFGHAGAENRGAVQAENGVDRGVVDEIRHQLMSAVLGLAESGFLISNIHKIIDVGMIGGKMSVSDTQGGIAPADGKVHQCNHSW